MVLIGFGVIVLVVVNEVVLVDVGTEGLLVMFGLYIIVWFGVLVVTIEVDVDGTVGVLVELYIVELLHSPKCCGLRFLA